MIFSYITYCYTTWSHTSEPLKSLFKRTLKIMDKKPQHDHYCNILSKYNILDFDSYQIFMDACLIFKVLNGLAPPPLRDFIGKKTRDGVNTRGDWNTQRRRTKFGQLVGSIRGSQTWNTLPGHVRN